jgi:hypothetical protein
MIFAPTPILSYRRLNAQRFTSRYATDEASGLCDHVMKIADAVAMIDAKAALAPRVRGPCKKRKSEAEISN